jgi:hypothetical protein
VAGGAELQDAVGGAVRGLAHLKALAPALPLYRRPDLEGGCGRTLAIFFDLVRQHGGGALHSSSPMVSLRFSVSESLHR